MPTSLSRNACLLAALAVALVAAAPSGARQAESGRLAVFAAASLTEVFPQLNVRPRYSFAGSDLLAAQIQLGARADVFAAASPKYPELLAAKGQCEKPVAFATNTLTVIVPKANPVGVHSVTDLTRPGVKVVIASKGVPVGAYTLTVLKSLGIAEAVLKNVVSQEPDVKSVVAKVALGEADAGFVYATDVRPVKAKVKRVAIPASAQPQVVYEACVVKGAPHPRAAHRFLTALVRPPAQALLVRYGFGRKP
jgi:molybdate transport system substrate-binding protein